MRKSLVGRSLVRGLARAMVAVLTSMLLYGCADEAPSSPASPRVSGPPVQSGKLLHWPEATTYLNVNFAGQPPTVELGAARPSGLGAFWSVASTRGAGSGFFYGNTRESDNDTSVAVATSAGRVAEIHDASAFDYSRGAVGPLGPGGIVLFRHAPSGRYLALVIDAIEPADPHGAGAGPYAFAYVTWYLTADQSADFSNAP
jgi:hypothetical protein